MYVCVRWVFWSVCVCVCVGFHAFVESGLEEHPVVALIMMHSLLGNDSMQFISTFALRAWSLDFGRRTASSYVTHSC